ARGRRQTPGTRRPANSGGMVSNALTVGWYGRAQEKTDVADLLQLLDLVRARSRDRRTGWADRALRALSRDVVREPAGPGRSLCRRRHGGGGSRSRARAPRARASG